MAIHVKNGKSDDILKDIYIFYSRWIFEEKEGFLMSICEIVEEGQIIGTW